MNFTILLTLINSLQGFSGNNSRNLEKATFEIIDRTSSEKLSNIDILFMLNNREFEELVDRILPKIDLKFTSRLNSSKFNDCSFKIILLKNFYEFSNFQQAGFKPSGYYLIILVKAETFEIENIFKAFWASQISNVIVFQPDLKNDTIQVKTFFPFQQGKCHDTTPVTINKFQGGKFENENFFPEKLSNLHQCIVKTAISFSNEPYAVMIKNPNGSVTLTGTEIKSIELLAEKLNFRIDFIKFDDVGYFYDNGTAKGPLKAVKDGTADLSIAGWWVKEARAKFMSMSTSYDSDPFFLILPSGRRLSSLEVLVYSFSVNLWIALLVTLGIGGLVIIIIRRMPKKVQNFVFGTGVNYPHLNMLIALVGGSQSRLPGRNFARFLLMLFLLFTLVLRTVYQGLYFELLQSNKIYNEDSTIEDMIDKNFKFYINEGNVDILNVSESLQGR